MSQHNVELTKRGVDALNRGDIDAFLELCTADVEWFPPMAGAIEGGAYSGREGMERYVREYGETWAQFSVDLDEYRPVGDRVVAAGRVEATGSASGIPVTMPIWAVSEFRGGKMARTRIYLDQVEAHRAVGLAEEGPGATAVDRAARLGARTPPA